MADDDRKLIEEGIAGARNDIRQTLDLLAYRTDVRARLPEYGRRVAESVGSALIECLAKEAARLQILSFKMVRGIGAAAATAFAQTRPFLVSLRHR